jgi:hypothetical protein
MNNQRKTFKKMAERVLRLSILFSCLAFLTQNFVAQQKTGVLELKNRTSATYSDGTNDFSAVSNYKTIKVLIPLKSGILNFKNSLAICSEAKSGDVFKSSQFSPKN